MITGEVLFCKNIAVPTYNTRAHSKKSTHYFRFKIKDKIVMGICRDSSSNDFLDIKMFSKFILNGGIKMDEGYIFGVKDIQIK
eukprot:GAHX01002667.1.p1 GENE.GAHX01002667.1~~GAHX01002667.1.p1  ORF type:complete len:83 (-),score=14.06 GAHX01002667.1:209-457(-)